LGDWDGCLFWLTLVGLVALGAVVAGIIVLFFLRLS
jgi:hypothetical protein